MAGVRHKKVMGGVDNPAYDASSGEWNEEHDIIDYYDVTPGTAEPATPDAGKRRHFYIDVGTTPNRRLAEGIKLDDGQVIWIYDLTV